MGKRIQEASGKSKPKPTPADRDQGNSGPPAGKEIIWAPQPKQALALSCPVYELFYGGAKGGGKSDFLLADYLYGVKYGDAHKGILFRRSYSELEELTARSRQLYPPLGATFAETKRTWTFPSGSTLKMRFLQRNADADNYQGHSYTYIGFDELGNWPNLYCYSVLQSCARSAEGIPVRIRSTGNPGGIGHSAVKARFIDNAPPGTIYTDPVTGLKRVYIKSLLDDNLKLQQNDPAYELRMKSLPAALYRAYRYGDWNVFVGQAFDFQDIHICQPLPIPHYAPLYMTFDWGYGKPFSVGWWWVDGDGRIYRFSEWYGFNGAPNEGLRMVDTRIAQGIKDREANLGIEGRQIFRLAGPDCFSRKPDYQGGGQGPSTDEVFGNHGIYLAKGDPTRLQKIKQFRERLAIPEDGTMPMVQVYDTCIQFIRTIPTLITDPDHMEDIDSSGEDHQYDEACHIMMARPLKLTVPQTRKTMAEIQIESIMRPKYIDPYEQQAYHEAEQSPFAEQAIYQDNQYGFQKGVGDW